jgi:hypothetical protein
VRLRRVLQLLRQRSQKGKEREENEPWSKARDGRATDHFMSYFLGERV